ncbi:hypothetical protein [Cellulomonas sp. Y8]|uniref:hypothetical protein n=1 Tax=Cellulomonas sp. Y8 TaxID=2591145 RepID=UPI003D713F6C
MAALAAGLLLTSCGQSEPSEDSTVFDGLDSSVVREVMDSPVAWGKVLQEEEQTRDSMAQGIVRNFIQCRSAFDAYRSWVTTGAAPDAPTLPEATHPIEPANTAIVQAQEYIEAAIDSGEPAQLRDFLVGEATCGEWIPVEEGRPDGPTIEDAVEALG